MNEDSQVEDVAASPQQVQVADQSVDNGAEGQQQQQQQQQVVPQVTPESIAEAVAAGMKNAAPAPQQPQMSPEEVRKHMNVWEPDDDFAGNFATAITPNEEGKIDAAGIKGVFKAMHANMMKQQETFARALVQQQTDQQQTAFAPVNDYVQTQQRQQLTNNFVEKYPTLKAYEKLIPMAAQQLQASGGNFSTPEQLFPALSSAMEQMVKQFVPTFSLNGSQNQGNPGGNAPATLLSGGQGGGNNAAPANTKSASIWG